VVGEENTKYIINIYVEDSLIEARVIEASEV
jgi:hypothetical protein